MNFEDLRRELEHIEQQLADPSFVSDYKRVAEASKRYAEIQRIIEAHGKSASGDTYEETIVEIRAGAGGDEAALFNAELFQMYENYAIKKGWSVHTLDVSQTTLGGYKQITFEMSGVGVLSAMKHESGVHRVQRIPDTEKAGRVHTSTVSVAVLPKAKETDVEIKPDDIHMEFYRAGGPGGQNVNKVSTAVRITHKPSGLVVSSQEERSQAQNREHAMDILRTKLLDMKIREQVGDITEERRRQIGTADRSEKIRTYNFPQDRITDHRIKKSWSNIEKILDGDLDSIITSMKEQL